MKIFIKSLGVRCARSEDPKVHVKKSIKGVRFNCR